MRNRQPQKTKMESIAFVPVRIGSKGIPKKNLIELYGKPLLYWVLNALQISNVDIVYVYGDDKRLENVIIPFTKTFYISRPPETATDTVQLEKGILNFLDHHPQYRANPFLTVQATNPWITPDDINKCLQSPFDVVGVAMTKHFVWDGQAKPLYDPSNRPQRQDNYCLTLENGSIYKSTVDKIKQSGCRISPPGGVYAMPEYTKLEVDEPYQLEQARALCDTCKCNPLQIRNRINKIVNNFLHKVLE